eukprot:366060-Chlamydomonas_euryale.AAC.2
MGDGIHACIPHPLLKRLPAHKPSTIPHLNPGQLSLGRRRCLDLWPRDQFSVARQPKKSGKVVPSPESSSWHPRIAELCIPEKP